MDCNCIKCDPSYQQDWKKWEESVNKWATENNIEEFSKNQVLYLHAPLNLLRLPCKKGRYD